MFESMRDETEVRSDVGGVEGGGLSDVADELGGESRTHYQELVNARRSLGKSEGSK